MNNCVVSTRIAWKNGSNVPNFRPKVKAESILQDLHNCCIGCSNIDAVDGTTRSRRARTLQTSTNPTAMSKAREMTSSAARRRLKITSTSPSMKKLTGQDEVCARQNVGCLYRLRHGAGLSHDGLRRSRQPQHGVDAATSPPMTWTRTALAWAAAAAHKFIGPGRKISYMICIYDIVRTTPTTLYV
jgi:hypothetical protein